MIVDEFTELLAAAAQVPLVMSIVLHSFITGVPFRLRAVRRALESIAGADGVWLTTPREIHQAVVESSQLFPAAGRGGDVVSEPAAAPNEHRAGQRTTHCRWCATGFAARCSRTSTCRSGPARSSAWSANPAPARACSR